MKHPMNYPFLMFGLLLLAGCAELTKHAETIKSNAELTATRLANINFEQADLVFDLEIENQNPVAISKCFGTIRCHWIFSAKPT
jgi:hypothetical protein